MEANTRRNPKRPLIRRLQNFIGLLMAYTRLNLNSQLEYRGAFVAQVVAMFVNDGMWLAFWQLFFSRFKILHGWTVNDMLTLWAIVTAGYGIGYAIFGNGLQLARLIAEGQLDAWMLYPRPVLPHVLVSKMTTTAWGDMLFGYLTYLIFIRPDLIHFVLYVAMTISVALLFVGFSVFTGSLSFYLGNATGLAEQWLGSTITFSTYPSFIFEGPIKILLYTAIPAGFMSYLPVEALRQLSLVDALLAVLGSLCVAAAGVWLFYRGLKRYESGNLMEMRG